MVQNHEINNDYVRRTINVQRGTKNNSNIALKIKTPNLFEKRKFLLLQKTIYHNCYFIEFLKWFHFFMYNLTLKRFFKHLLFTNVKQ